MERQRFLKLLMGSASSTFLASSIIEAQFLQARSQNLGTRPRFVNVERDLVYAILPKKTLLLDLYLPEATHVPFPAIIWIHGGGWRQGSKNNCPILRMTALGYAIASINYRLSHEAIFPAQIEDCKAAVRWLRANAAQYNLDDKRIGAWGASAGGHLAALLGTSGHVSEWDRSGGNYEHSSRIQTVCNFFGPTDFLKMDIPLFNVPPSAVKHTAPNSPESQLIGGPILENLEKVARANPITYITKECPPFFIAHGNRDHLVPISQSILLYEALKKAGIEVIFYEVDGAGHEGRRFYEGPSIQKAVDDFLHKYLKSAGWISNYCRIISSTFSRRDEQNYIKDKI